MSKTIQKFFIGFFAGPLFIAGVSVALAIGYLPMIIGMVLEGDSVRSGWMLAEIFWLLTLMGILFASTK